MKKITNILAYVAFVLFAVSCAKSTDEVKLVMGDNEGALALNIDYGTTRGEVSADQAFSMKIYRYGAANSTGERAKELVRKYTSQSDVPQYIYLLKDDYCVSVTVGEKVNASFEEKYYVGSADFTITPSKVAEVDVTCKMQNISAAVKFDTTVEEHFTGGYYTYICASDSFNLDQAVAGKVPTLKYESSSTGYFMLPKGCKNLSWYFYGTDGTTPVAQSGVIKDVEPLTLYTLNFKYSKDAPGFLVISATVDTSAEHRDDKISFSPDPTVKGDGFNIKEKYNYVSGSRKYVVTALDNITQLNITTPDATLDLLSGTYAGVAVTEVSKKEYHIVLSEEFFATLAGGEQEFSFRIKDASGGVGFTTVTYGIQGVLPIGDDDYDLWFTSADFQAVAFNNPSNVKVGFRLKGGEWTMLNASAAGSENMYNALANTFTANKTYEYAMFIGSTQVGKILTINTPAGAQIPEADFEHWVTADDGSACPTSSVLTATWDTGNHATATLGLENLTYGKNEPRPGSAGSTSAYLHSIKATVFGVGKFAAGNLFVGKFVRIDGMGGIVDFGKRFDYTARPTALKFWMKNNSGTINEGSHTTGADLIKIYVCLCDRPLKDPTDPEGDIVPYTVNTNDESTLFDPTTAPNVIAYGVYESKTSTPNWTEMTIDLTYKDNNTKPNSIVLTFTCSGYGDYFTGSTNSWMYVDDVELVY